MGPIIIFDKSALQSISLDESVFLQNFFLTNMTPIFLIETLADLEKEPNKGKSPEQIVGELANKTPEMGIMPNIYHHNLVIGDLLGRTVEMSRRPIIDGGTPKITPDGKIGFYFDEPPEKKALKRWQDRKFLEVERDYAREWRQSLSNLSFETQMGMVKNIVPPEVHFSNLSDIKAFIDKFIATKDKSVLDLAFEILEVPSKLRTFVYERWNKDGQPPINIFSPYASFVLSVDLVFYLGLNSSFISKDRPSNKIDLSYLYYLPFCMVFVSKDKLHQRTVPLFLKEGQVFVWGDDFKEGMKELDNYFSQYQEEISKHGLIRFAPYPPQNSFISKLWDTMGSKWRGDASKAPLAKSFPTLPNDSSLVKRLNKMRDEAKPLANPELYSPDDADHVTISHMVHLNKGKWRILPEGIENNGDKD
ncbi:MAG: hypothetical protein WC069_00585 [Candidatus Shapirobacteria bacterium]